MTTPVHDRNAPEALHHATGHLAEGGVIVVPTDTVYGLAVLPTFPESVKRLFAIKSRPDSVNLPIMVAGIEQLDAGVVSESDVSAPPQALASPEARSVFGSVHRTGGASPIWRPRRREPT